MSSKPKNYSPNGCLLTLCKCMRVTAQKKKHGGKKKPYVKAHVSPRLPSGEGSWSCSPGVERESMRCPQWPLLASTVNTSQTLVYILHGLFSFGGVCVTLALPLSSPGNQIGVQRPGSQSLRVLVVFNWKMLHLVGPSGHLWDVHVQSCDNAIFHSSVAFYCLLMTLGHLLFHLKHTINTGQIRV